MVNHTPNPEERKLLEDVRAALASERDRRSRSEHAAFTARVMESVKDTGVEPAADQERTPWFRKKLTLLAAAAFLGVLGVMAMMTDMFSGAGQPDMRPQRVAAERVPVLRDNLVIEDPELFAGVESEILFMFTYDHFGERCLWLYPDRLIRWGENPKADEAFRKRKKWRATVQKGRIEIPAEALEELDPGAPFILLKIEEHFEVWSEPALTRYLAKSKKKS